MPSHSWTRRSSSLQVMLINAGRGKLERVFDHLYARTAAFGKDHFHDIETKQDVGIIEQTQPGERAARDALLLLPADGFERPAERFAGPSFYFDEDERVVVAADNVDLAPGVSAEIAIEDLITVPPQEPAGQSLATRAALQMLGRRGIPRAREAVAPPVRKTGDGSGKGRIHGVWRDAVRCCSLCAC